MPPEFSSLVVVVVVAALAPMAVVLVVSLVAALGIAMLPRLEDSTRVGAIILTVFFIYSGMTLDIKSISENPLRLVVFLFVMLAIRGLPALFFYRTELPRIERVQLMFLTATALPLLIALTEVGVTKGTMNPAMQASVIGAGVLSVLLFPLIAVTLQRRKTVSATLAAQPSPLES
jgi:Kef-type K+ transport system membrane component KefB